MNPGEESIIQPFNRTPFLQKVISLVIMVEGIKYTMLRCEGDNEHRESNRSGH